MLAAKLEFRIKSRVGGLCAPMTMSEFRLLSEAERRLKSCIPVEVSAARVPIVANCAAVDTPLAVSYARQADDVGADGVIAMPPHIRRPEFETIFVYCRAISDAASMPVWIQNASVVALSPHQVVRLYTEVENMSQARESSGVERRDPRLPTV